MKLAILDDYQQIAMSYADWSSVESRCEVSVFSQHIGEKKAVVNALKDYSIICCMRERTPFPADVLKQLPKLKLLVTSGAKNAAIDLIAAQELGILVCGTESPGHAASELAWALIMSLAKNIHIENKMIREGRWQTTIGSDLKGQTLGIVGLGRHGENVARFGHAFGMNCIAWSQNLTEERCVDLGVKKVDKKTLFKTSDFITIHLKMGQRNRGIISNTEFDSMKPGAVLVNTSRGPIIDEKALLLALSEEKIGGVGLDVYDVEPLPKDHPLLLSERVLLAPHIGYVTRQTYQIFYGQMLENVLAWLQGNPVRLLNA